MANWKSVVGYEDLYEVSDEGEVKSLIRDHIDSDGRVSAKILKQNNGTSGYKIVALAKERTYKTKMVHRLVAAAWLPNPSELPCVNHLNGNKEDNRTQNLEWCTYKHNLQHALMTGLKLRQCNIQRSVVVTKDDKILRFDSMKECAEYFGFGKCWMHNRIRKHGNPFEYNGYIFLAEERAVKRD
jgi:hypothetical protein